MNENEIKDIGYTSLKMGGGLLSYTIDELVNKQIIKNYRDLSPESVRAIYRNIDENTVSSRTYNNLMKVIKSIDRCKLLTEEYIKKSECSNIHVISVFDSHYPYAWRQLSGMPKVFFAKGDINILKDTFSHGTVGIVGSRDPCRYASYATNEFTKKLCEKGVVIVSGLALGIDGDAHRAAISNDGKTIGISPCGPDVIYPYQHESLYKDIYEKGVVISEMPPGQGVMKQYFPSRNRLISALSDVVLIMEAGLYSGTLHTASFAGNQGKDVFVLPNSVYYENCVGGLMLIRDGAEVLIDSETVLNRIKGIVLDRVRSDGEDYIELLVNRGQLSKVDEDPLVKMENNPGLMTKEDWKDAIMALIEIKPRNFDELSMLIPIDTGTLMSYITEMEMASDIESNRDKYVLTIQKR